jgi:enamine deaminase RidA (YjgF/YER057c/UK114 family)
MKERECKEQGQYTIHRCALNKSEYLLTAPIKLGAGDNPTIVFQAYQDLVEIIKDLKAEIVLERVFGELSFKTEIEEIRLRLGLSGKDKCPLSHIQGCPLKGHGIAGIQMHIVVPQNAKVWTVYENGKSCGRGWERDGVQWFVLQDMHGLEQKNGHPLCREYQAQRRFERAEGILKSQGAAYSNIVRTWIYLDQILDWYAEFNDVRNAKYKEWGIMPQGESGPEENLRLPASTGILGSTSSGAACTMDLVAIKRTTDAPVKITQMTNVKQKDAFRYGRAFSRGAWIQSPGSSIFHISGTAAIDEEGQSLFINDPAAQIHRTLDNIEALLDPANINLSQICSGTVFIKRPQDVDLYCKIAEERKLTSLPIVNVIADVCRPELLFEMDAIAGRPEP